MNNINPDLNQKILNEVHNKLHPNKVSLLSKLFFIHFLTATITLSICPQFGFQVFKSDYNLMELFMYWGKPFCDFACGAFFTGTSMMSAHFILSHDEIRFLRFNKTLTIASLLLTSIGFFMIMSPNLFLELTLLWLIGTTLAIISSLEISFHILLKTNQN